MAEHKLAIGQQALTVEDFRHIATGEAQVVLGKKAIAAINGCREWLEGIMQDSQEQYYGINTGFGSLCNIRIPDEELQRLQENLVRSHACGLGKPIADEAVRLMLVQKVQSLSYGHSGIRLQTVERLLYFYENDLLPLVPEQGSLGASGDLAPLAHLCLPLIGEGHLKTGGQHRPAAEVLQQCGLQPLQLGAKEGLALLNGTQYMNACGTWALLRATKLWEKACMTAALSLDAWFGRIDPFDQRIHAIRPHPGQVLAAGRVRRWLEDSPITGQNKPQIQDPYAFRCTPQVLGASYDAIQYASEVFHREINSVTDNPLIFHEDEAILSGGNFHGQPLALALDFLCLALSEVGSISERRTFNLVSGKNGLPEFLISNPGLNSGLMIPQYTAAALASQNKTLCMPASADSITSSNGQEDHVSMGANAAIKLLQVLENTENIVAIEWLTAAQALELRRPLTTSPALEKLMGQYRRQVPFLENDRFLQPDMLATRRFLDGLGQEP